MFTMLVMGIVLVKYKQEYSMSMGECNTIKSAYTKYRHLDSVALTHRCVSQSLAASDKNISCQRGKISESNTIWLSAFVI